jgi:hypothetical protein
MIYRDCINGSMDVCLKVNGLIIKCTGKGSTLGLMEEGMRENMNVTKSMALEYITGLMEEFMKDNGLMENNKGRENI